MNRGGLADWGTTNDDAFGFGSTGTALEVTPVDMQVMEALGWKQANDDWLPSAPANWSTASDWSGGIPVVTSKVVVAQGAAEVTSSIIAESIALSGQIDFTNAGDSQVYNGVDITGGDLYMDVGSGGGTVLTIGGALVNTGNGVIRLGNRGLSGDDNITALSVNNTGGYRCAALAFDAVERSGFSDWSTHVEIPNGRCAHIAVIRGGMANGLTDPKLPFERRRELQIVRGGPSRPEDAQLRMSCQGRSGNSSLTPMHVIRLAECARGRDVLRDRVNARPVGTSKLCSAISKSCHRIMKHCPTRSRSFVPWITKL